MKWNEVKESIMSVILFIQWCVVVLGLFINVFIYTNME